MRTPFIIIIVFFLESISFSQIPVNWTQENAFMFKSYLPQDGFSFTGLSGIVHDEYGFVWFGSREGMYRFDGSNFTRFAAITDQPAAPGKNVTPFLCDHSGKIWIRVLEKGMILFNTHSNSSQYFPNESTLDFGDMVDVVEEDQENIWILTSGQFPVIRYNIAERKFTPYSFPDTIKGQCFDGTIFQHKLFIATLGGVVVLNCRTGIVEHFFKDQFTDPKALSTDPVVFRSIYNDEAGTIYCGLWKSALTEIYTLDKNTGRFTQYVSDVEFGPVLCITRRNNNTLWLGCSGGLVLFDIFSKQFSPVNYNNRNNRSIPDNINPFCESIHTAHGATWVAFGDGVIATDNRSEQIHIYNLVEILHPVNNFHSFHPNYVMPLHNKLLISSWEGEGLYILDSAQNTVIPVSVPDVKDHRYNAVRGIFTDHEGVNWVFNSHFIFTLDTNTWQLKEFPFNAEDIPGYEKNFFFCSFFEDSRHFLWLGTNRQGIICIPPDRTGYILYPVSMYDPSSANRIQIVTAGPEDDEGRVWFCSMQGAFYFDPASGKFTNVTQPSSDPQFNDGRGLMKDAEGNIWRLANFSGIQKWMENTRSFSPADWVTDVSSIGFDDVTRGPDGNWYASGNEQVYCINLEQHKLSSINRRLNFNIGSAVLGFDKHGNLMVLNGDKLVQVDIQSMDENNRTDRVMICRLEVMGKDTLFDQNFNDLQKIEFSHNQNFITIQFGVPEGNPNASKYFRYRLKGLQNTWVNAGTVTTASFAGLDPGTYELELQSVDINGDPLTDIRTLTILIRSAWYQSIWSRIALFLLIAGAVYGIYSYRLNQLMRLQEVRNKISRDLHDNVGTSLGSISFYSQLAKKLDDGDNKQVTEILNKIETNSRTTVETMADIVWAIHPANDNFEKLIDRWQNYGNELFHPKQIAFHLEIEAEVDRQMKLNVDSRKNIFLIFKEAMYNAAKYSQAKDVWLRVKKNGHHLEFFCMDNGTGFDGASPSYNGNGLRNMRTRAAEIGAKLEVVTARNSGTRIRLLMSGW